MVKHYLDLDYKNTCFYEYSSVEKEDFVEHKSPTGKVSYRKLYRKGVYGLLQSVGVVKSDRGMLLSIRLLLEDDVYLLALPLYDVKGNFDNRFVEPLIPILLNMKKNLPYRIFPWGLESETITKKDGSPKMIYGVSVKNANLDTLTVEEGEEAKVLPLYKRRKRGEDFDEKIHIPELEFVEEFGSWKPTAVSIDNRKRFLKSLLDKALTNLSYDSNNTHSGQSTSNTQSKTPTPYKPVNTKVEKPSTTKQDTYTPPTAPTEDLIDDDYDDLPF